MALDYQTIEASFTPGVVRTARMNAALDEMYKFLFSRLAAVPQLRQHADDIVQDFLRKLTRRGGPAACNYLASDGNFEGWLTTSIRRKAIDHLRKRNRELQRRLLSEQGDGTENLPDTSLQIDDNELLSAAQDASLLREVMAKLAPGDGYVLFLFSGDLSIKEIAEDLRISIDAAKQRLSRARKRLRALIIAQRPELAAGRGRPAMLRVVEGVPGVMAASNEPRSVVTPRAR